jgi:hypothetical protein
MADETEAASLIDELRRDTELDDELEVEALSRVERRLRLRVIRGGRSEPNEAPRAGTGRAQARWWRSTRGGMLAALLVGTALGAGGHALGSLVSSSLRLAPAPPRAVADESGPRKTRGGEQRLAAPSRVPDPAPQPASAAQQAEPIDLPAAQASPLKPVVAEPTVPRGIEHELRELELARAAVIRGDGAGALKVLAEHERSFRSSVLAQEREALTVKALVLVGRHGEARQLGAAFRARHPNSMLLDSVERALTSIP